MYYSDLQSIKSSETAGVVGAEAWGKFRNSEVREYLPLLDCYSAVAMKT
jgi:hypothetical protein